MMGRPHLVDGNERETSPISQTASGSMSENESGERSARQKLKQASLVAMENSQVPDAPGQSDVTIISPLTAQENSGQVSREQSEHTEEGRGRISRKRSFEELQSTGEHVVAPHSETTDATLAHVRKRSRDHAFEATSDNRARSHLESSGVVGEEGREAPSSGSAETCLTKHLIDVSGTKSENPASSDVDERNGNGRTQPGSRDRESPQTYANPSAVEEKASPSWGPSDGSASPRKKRSREHFDTEPIREQKIIATEESRAQRLSSELGRVEGSLLVGNGSPEPGAYHNDVERKGGFPRKTTADLSSPTGPPILPLPNSETARSSAFAASGFAALANSSASPFSNLGAGGFTPSSFALDASKPLKPDNGGFLSFASPRSPPSEVSGSAAKSSPATGNGGPSASPFATASRATAGAFGGAAFGSATGSGLHAGSKLTTFAASTGNTQIGGNNGNIQALGSPHLQAGEGRDSESDGGNDEGASKHDGLPETDQRFQQQDVETGEDGEESLFTSRASLYSFKNNVWKESGRGIFKFNVASSPPEQGASKTGRFIMRAHQTFRVLLNTPVFKEMKIGDSRGQEPAGKSFAFAVLEDGKPTPHMIKLGDAAECKMLYSAVQELQQELD